MKRVVAAVTGSLMMASVAMAAAPAAPVLSVVSTKMAEGNCRAPGSKVIAADGTNFYVAYTTPGWNVASGDRYVKLVRSTDGGVTWKGSHTVTFAQNYTIGGSATVAVSGDAVYPTQKIAHVVWEQDGVLYYSSADVADLDTWSAPLKITGSAPGGYMPEIVTSKTGAVHVMYQGDDNRLYYTTATSHEAGFFTEPVAVTALGEKYDSDAEFTMDKSGNLHLSYSFTDGTKVGIRYKKLTAGSSTWANAVTVMPLTTLVNGYGVFAAITSYDANNLYIASQWDDTTLFVFSSTNGGATWTKKTVFARTATACPTRHVGVAVNGSKVVTVGTGFDISDATGNWIREEARIFRSTDGGLTWSNGTVIAGQTSVSIAIDSAGKAGISTYSASGFEGEQSLYFSKEK